jgi:voltage-gated potassium channel Kch
VQLNTWVRVVVTTGIWLLDVIAVLLAMLDPGVNWAAWFSEVRWQVRQMQDAGRKRGE